MRFLSEPVKVYWAGFESNTFRLEQEGWSISANQDVANDSMELAMRHERAGLYAITRREHNWGYREQMYAEMRWERRPPLKLHIEEMRSHIQTRQIHSLNYTDFSPIRSTPMVVEMDRIESLADMVHFAPLHTKQIILPPDTVPDLMKRILEMQEPGREAHFRKMTAEARKTAPTLHASIFSMVA